ncbi:hypothetical protein CYMTET_32699, partial [Cymbomonas tetramitiformis]
MVVGKLARGAISLTGNIVGKKSTAQVAVDGDGIHTDGIILRVLAKEKLEVALSTAELLPAPGHLLTCPPAPCPASAPIPTPVVSKPTCFLVSEVDPPGGGWGESVTEVGTTGLRRAGELGIEAGISPDDAAVALRSTSGLFVLKSGCIVGQVGLGWLAAAGCIVWTSGTGVHDARHYGTAGAGVAGRILGQGLGVVIAAGAFCGISGGAFCGQAGGQWLAAAGCIALDEAQRYNLHVAEGGEHGFVPFVPPEEFALVDLIGEG